MGYRCIVALADMERTLAAWDPTSAVIGQFQIPGF